MYTYLVKNRAENNHHFYKFQYLDEVRNYISHQNSQSSNYPIGGAHMSASEDTNTPNANVDVYRTKDIVDALNTSIIMDGMQKENYLKLLSGESKEFTVDNNFSHICKEVGSCDIY